MRLPRLLLLTDRSQLRLGRSLMTTIGECVDAGLEAVIVREHDLPGPARSALITDLAAIDGLTVLASHAPHRAAAGLHVAADQPAPTGFGRWGRSCHSRAEVERAAGQGAGWATLSPYDVSASKPGYGPPLPPGEYDDLPIPTFALAGVTPDNAAKARAAGAYGVAVMGAVMRAADPADVVRRLLREVA